MRVLVTGENSYAGKQFAERIAELDKKWAINFVSVRDNSWKQKDFSYYDAVYHVAGIVHVKETSDNKELYYRVNRDLTYQLALKAKNEGVKSFVFLSTMAIYGLIGKIGEETVISKETQATPISHYGKSKLQAERKLGNLQSSEFNISILRVPMIYGPNCPGNYELLSRLARKTPVFPKINNRRSMIYIDHLSDIVTYLIEKNFSGVFLVKNPEDVNTSKVVREISRVHKHRLYSSSLLGFLIRNFGNHISATRKMFSNFVYKDSDCLVTGFTFAETSFEESIIKSEQK